MTYREPPFDGEPCPACPTAVRALFAAAYNAHGALTRARTGEGDWDRAWRKLNELGRQLDDFQSLIDAHFADKRHAHPHD